MIGTHSFILWASNWVKIILQWLQLPWKKVSMAIFLFPYHEYHILFRCYVITILRFIFVFLIFNTSPDQLTCLIYIRNISSSLIRPWVTRTYREDRIRRHVCKSAKFWENKEKDREAINILYEYQIDIIHETGDTSHQLTGSISLA